MDDSQLVQTSIEILSQLGIIDDATLFPGQTLISLGGNIVYSPAALKEKQREIVKYWMQFSETFDFALFDKIFKADQAKDAQWMNLSRVRDYVQNWCINPEGILSITSIASHKTPGGGKTLLARCAGTNLIHRNIPVVFWRVPNAAQAWFSDGKNFKTELKENLMSFGDLKAGLIHVGQNAPVLILDDFGMQYQSDFVDFFLNTIISDRSDSKKPTIITSPFSLQDLDQQFPEISSRLKGKSAILGATSSHIDYRTLNV